MSPAARSPQAPRAEALCARPPPGRESPRDRPARHGIYEEIPSQTQRRFMQRRRIVMRLGILPPVAEIARVRVVNREAISEKNPESACRLPVVLVNLRNALRQIVNGVIDGMGERHVHELPIGEHALDLTAKALVHAVVVVGVKKATVLQIL